MQKQKGMLLPKWHILFAGQEEYQRRRNELVAGYGAARDEMNRFIEICRPIWYNVFVFSVQILTKFVRPRFCLEQSCSRPPAEAVSSLPPCT